MNEMRFLASSELKDARSEIIRKSIHLLIAFSPGVAVVSRTFAIGILGAGVLLYTLFEVLRHWGIRVPVVSGLTSAVSRPRDSGRFVLGPVTLGAGAILAFIYFPPVAATVAVYALAFGDSAASLVGKFFGRIRPAFLCGKSIEGSFACFIVVYYAALIASGSVNAAFVAAIDASLAEALPLDDFDNIVIPLAAGLAVSLVL